MSVDAPQRPLIRVGEVRNAAISLAGKLDAGESLTGTPTVTPSPASLTISSVAVSTAELDINGKSVAAGLAVTCRIDATGALDKTTYELLVAAATDATPAQTVIARIKLDARA